MKVNSISGVLCYASDLERTAKYYEALGFRIGKREPGRLTCYVNWFWVTFVGSRPRRRRGVAGGAAAENRGAGLHIYVKVDDLDGYYKGVLAAGMTPSGEPRKRAGVREFMLRDPDGYRLVFFEKK
jgi:catechol 2,3-dioxygenase-like lactoylglutathione lyase family enzyme